jgi:hypothetical protein
MRLLSLIITSIVIVNCCFAEDNQEIYKELCGYWMVDPNCIDKLIDAEFNKMFTSKEFKNEEEKLEKKASFRQQSQENYIYYTGFIMEFKRDKSMVRFPSLPLCKDRKYMIGGLPYFFKTEIHNEKIKFVEIKDKQPGYPTKSEETEFRLEGNKLSFKWGESAIDYIKVDANSPLVAKPKIFTDDSVSIPPPPEFYQDKRDEPGVPITTYGYRNPQDQIEGISLMYMANYFFLDRQPELGLDASHRQRLEAAYKSTEGFPDNPKEFEFTKLDGEEVIVCSETRTIENKQYYVKKYLIIDDGWVTLNIEIRASSLEKLEVLDESVKKIKIDMYGVWN